MDQNAKNELLVALSSMVARIQATSGMHEDEVRAVITTYFASDAEAVDETNTAKLVTPKGAYLSAKAVIAEWVNGSPELLDTIQEIANALNNDPDAFNTLMTAITDNATDITNLTQRVDALGANSSINFTDPANQKFLSEVDSVVDTLPNGIYSGFLTGVQFGIAGEPNLGLGTVVVTDHPTEAGKKTVNKIWDNRWYKVVDSSLGYTNDWKKSVEVNELNSALVPLNNKLVLLDEVNFGELKLLADYNPHAVEATPTEAAHEGMIAGLTNFLATATDLSIPSNLAESTEVAVVSLWVRRAPTAKYYYTAKVAGKTLTSEVDPAVSYNHNWFDLTAVGSTGTTLELTPIANYTAATAVEVAALIKALPNGLYASVITTSEGTAWLETATYLPGAAPISVMITVMDDVTNPGDKIVIYEVSAELKSYQLHFSTKTNSKVFKLFAQSEDIKEVYTDITAAFSRVGHATGGLVDTFAGIYAAGEYPSGSPFNLTFMANGQWKLEQGTKPVKTGWWLPYEAVAADYQIKLVVVTGADLDGSLSASYAAVIGQKLSLSPTANPINKHELHFKHVPSGKESVGIVELK